MLITVTSYEHIITTTAQQPDTTVSWVCKVPMGLPLYYGFDDNVYGFDDSIYGCVEHTFIEGEITIE